MRSHSIGAFRVLIFLASLGVQLTSLSDVGWAQTGSFRFAAIGDAGEPGAILDANARVLDSISEALDALVFLGDNFYPIGLNVKPPRRRELLRAALGSLRATLETLGPARVHAIAGNHDYYCQLVGAVPLGRCFTGNRIEQRIPWWTYHWRMPSTARWPIRDGSHDSVEFIFVDSGLLLASPAQEWTPYLDSLERLLRASGASGVRWRVLASHHGLRTVGEHGGYRRWSSTLQRVLRIGNCAEEGEDPFRYAYEFVSNADNCHPDYRRYIDAMQAIIDRSGARIHLMLSGHDHSLQLIADATPGPFGPHAMVVSGAGSILGRVAGPRPPIWYSHPENDELSQGRSAPGFVIGTIDSAAIELRFVDGRSGTTLDMGGATSFRIDSAGTVTAR